MLIVPTDNAQLGGNQSSSNNGRPLYGGDRDRGGDRGRSGSGGNSYRDSRNSRDVDFVNFGSRNRRGAQENGRDYRYPNNDRGGDRPVNSGNDRWQEQPRNDRWPDRNDQRTGGSGGRWKDEREGGNKGGRSEIDWTVPTARDEHLEEELFGTGNTGINFSKYEDIPVEATGENIPTNITSVS